MKNVLVAGSYSPDVKEKIMNLLGGHFNLYFASRQEELLEHPETDYVILRILRMNEKEMDAMPSLKFIQRWGAGVDTVDIKAAGKRGIIVANIAGGNAPAVAEQAVNLMLATLRNTAFIDKNIRDGKWIKSSIEGRSYMLKGKKVGLLGAGNIGRRVAGIVQAFGPINRRAGGKTGNEVRFPGNAYEDIRYYQYPHTKNRRYLSYDWKGTAGINEAYCGYHQHCARRDY